MNSRRQFLANLGVGALGLAGATFGFSNESRDAGPTRRCPTAARRRG